MLKLLCIFLFLILLFGPGCNLLILNKSQIEMVQEYSKNSAERAHRAEVGKMTPGQMSDGLCQNAIEWNKLNTSIQKSLGKSPQECKE